MAICESDETVLESELMILKEVYFNELESISPTVDGTVINVVIKPNTCDDPERQFIKFLLSFVCSQLYPSVPPLISIKMPRGLTEEEVIRLTEDLEKLAEEKIGDPMLFDIVLHAKEFITDQNIPHTVCSICLDGFSSENDIFKTPQFHFYHNQCIANFVRYETDKHRVQVDELLSYDPYIKDLPELSILCPLCREEEIKCSPEFVKRHDKPFETVNVVIPEEWKQKSKELQALFEKQLRMTEEAVSNASQTNEGTTTPEKVSPEYSEATATRQAKPSRQENWRHRTEGKYDYSESSSGSFRGSRSECHRPSHKSRRDAGQRNFYSQKVSRNHYYAKGASLKDYETKPRFHDRTMTNEKDQETSIATDFESNVSSSRSNYPPNRRDNRHERNSQNYQRDNNFRQDIAYHYCHPSSERHGQRNRDWHERQYQFEVGQGTSQYAANDSNFTSSAHYHRGRRKRDHYYRGRNFSTNSYSENHVPRSDDLPSSNRDHVQTQSGTIENEYVSQGD